MSQAQRGTLLYAYERSTVDEIWLHLAGRVYLVERGLSKIDDDAYKTSSKNEIESLRS